MLILELIEILSLMEVPVELDDVWRSCEILPEHLSEIHLVGTLRLWPNPVDQHENEQKQLFDQHETGQFIAEHADQRQTIDQFSPTGTRMA